jgi:hypothetical protein
MSLIDDAKTESDPDKLMGFYQGVDVPEKQQKAVRLAALENPEFPVDRIRLSEVEQFERVGRNPNLITWLLDLDNLDRRKSRALEGSFRSFFLEPVTGVQDVHIIARNKHPADRSDVRRSMLEMTWGIAHDDPFDMKKLPRQRRACAERWVLSGQMECPLFPDMLMDGLPEASIERAAELLGRTRTWTMQIPAPPRRIIHPWGDHFG